MKRVILITMMLLVTTVLIAQEVQSKVSDEETKVEQAIKEFEAMQAQAQTSSDHSASTLRMVSFVLLSVPYLLLCVLATVVGSYRTIGAGGAFFLSLFFTPIVGLYVVATSERKTTVEFRKRLTEEMNKQTKLIEKLSSYKR